MLTPELAGVLTMGTLNVPETDSKVPCHNKVVVDEVRQVMRMTTHRLFGVPPSTNKGNRTIGGSVYMIMRPGRVVPTIATRKNHKSEQKAGNEHRAEEHSRREDGLCQWLVKRTTGI